MHRILFSFLTLCFFSASLPAANLTVSYYHGAVASLQWQETPVASVESSTLGASAASQRYRSMTLNLRSNMQQGYSVTVDVQSLGASSATAPKIAMQSLKKGAAVASTQISGNYSESAVLEFSGDALARTGDASATPDQVRVTVDAGAPSKRPRQGRDVVTLTVAPR